MPHPIYDDIPSAKAIKPKEKGVSDFFSWNFYRFAKENPLFTRVFKGVWNRIDGYNPQEPTYYIGMIDDNGAFNGILLSHMLCMHKRFDMSCYMMPKHHIEEWQDVSADFYAEYQRIGYCLLDDHHHEWGDTDAKRDEANAGHTRTCQRCGKQETLTAIARVDYLWESHPAHTSQTETC
jgi:hypothetical protein